MNRVTKYFLINLVQAFNIISKDEKSFWINLEDNQINEALIKNTPQFSQKELSLEEYYGK